MGHTRNESGEDRRRDELLFAKIQVQMFVYSFKKANQWELNQETSKFNNVFRHSETKNITEKNNFIEAATRIVAKQMRLRTKNEMATDGRGNKT